MPPVLLTWGKLTIITMVIVLKNLINRFLQLVSGRKRGRKSAAYSFLWQLLSSQPFFPNLPCLHRCSAVETTQKSQKTYSKSWRLQLGCRKTSHSSFAPSSCNQFDPRSRCIRLLLCRRQVERYSLLSEVKWQRLSLQEGQCEERWNHCSTSQRLVSLKRFHVTQSLIYLPKLHLRWNTLAASLSHLGNLGLHPIGLKLDSCSSEFFLPCKSNVNLFTLHTNIVPYGRSIEEQADGEEQEKS